MIEVDEYLPRREHDVGWREHNVGIGWRGRSHQPNPGGSRSRGIRA